MSSSYRSLYSAIHEDRFEDFCALSAPLLAQSDFKWSDTAHVKTGDHVLHVLCRLGRVHMLNNIQNRSPGSWEHPNFEGKTLLHEAAQFKCIHVVEFLLKHHVSVDAIKRADWTPLMLAATKKDNLSVVRALLKAEANPKLRNKDGWTPFHLAAREGDWLMMQELLATDSNLWQTLSKNDRTPLHSVCLAGHVTALEWMLDHCQYPRGAKDSCGSTPLMDAIRGGHLECIKKLIKVGESLFDTDSFGRNSLHCAAHANQAEVVKMLLTEFEVSADSLSEGGMTPLHWAALEGQELAAKVLVQVGKCDVTMKDDKNRTAAQLARMSKHDNLAKFLDECANK